jgi:hypothetical protein
LLDARSERAAIKQRTEVKVKCRYTIVPIVADYGWRGAGSPRLGMASEQAYNQVIAPM